MGPGNLLSSFLNGILSPMEGMGGVSNPFDLPFTQQTQPVLQASNTPISNYTTGIGFSNSANMGAGPLGTLSPIWSNNDNLASNGSGQSLLSGNGIMNLVGGLGKQLGFNTGGYINQATSNQALPNNAVNTFSQIASNTLGVPAQQIESDLAPVKQIMSIL